jgi:hypothetical protein
VESESPDYLQPYVNAIRRHGPVFRSLLWTSPATQAARFDAIVRVESLHGRKIRPNHYVGLEAVKPFADAARRKNQPDAQIVEADFVKEPHRLCVGAEVIVFCGSLNTLNATGFFESITAAYQAASIGVVFNFLCSTRLAGSHYLNWHRATEVESRMLMLSDDVTVLNDYLDGDCTIAVRKVGER